MPTPGQILLQLLRGVRDCPCRKKDCLVCERSLDMALAILRAIALLKDRHTATSGVSTAAEESAP